MILLKEILFLNRNDTTITHLYQSTAGCDSTVINHVIIRTIVNDIIVQICEGETFSESTTGHYTHTELLPSGIDSITNLYLTVRELPTVSFVGRNSLCNGSVSIMAGGGNSYMWSTGENSQEIVVSEAGTYSVTVTNEYGCTASAEHPIAREVQINVAYDPILCYGNSTEVVVTAQYGIAPYTGERTETVMAGQRTYRVTDSDGCSAQATITITEPDELTSSHENIEAYCNDRYGTINVTPSGGVAP